MLLQVIVIVIVIILAIARLRALNIFPDHFTIPSRLVLIPGALAAIDV